MTEKLNKKLENGEVIIGAYIFGGFPMMTEAISLCGYDVLWIDMEHHLVKDPRKCRNREKIPSPILIPFFWTLRCV